MNADNLDVELLTLCLLALLAPYVVQLLAQAWRERQRRRKLYREDKR